MAESSRSEHKAQPSRRAWGVVVVVTLATLLLASGLAMSSLKEAQAAETPWINELAYGSAGGGFYWDTASGQVWTAERSWHTFSPQPARAVAPLWVNHLSYGSAGGGFYWDPVSNQVWTAERSWHTFNPRPTLKPIALAGSGQKATDAVTLGGGVWVVRFTYSGSSNFIVHGFNSSGKELFLANEIGVYAGSKSLPGNDSYRFDIQASGPWTITLSPIGEQSEPSSSGKGDVVSGMFPYFGGPKTFDITHNGSRNFIVHLECDKGTVFVQNVIGPVNGSRIVNVPAGSTACYWEVQADGDWSLTDRK